MSMGIAVNESSSIERRHNGMAARYLSGCMQSSRPFLSGDPRLGRKYAGEIDTPSDI